MIDDTPQGIGNDSPLSISDAAAAYANIEAEEAPEGQADAEETPEGEEAVADEDQDGAVEEETEEDGQQEEVAAAPAYVPGDGKVKLPDGTELTVDELSKGYFRDRDYRQKTMELGEQKRSHEAKTREVQALEQQLSVDRDFMVQLMQSLMPQKPDASLMRDDPVGYQEQRAYYEDRKEQLNYLLQQSQQEAARRQKAQEDDVSERRKTEWEATLEAMPDLRDSTKLKAFVSDVEKHGVETYKFSQQELRGIGDDHRLVMVLRDAIQWRNLQARKPAPAATAKVEGRPPVQRGGTRPAPGLQKARDVKQAMDRLTQSGSLKDGVAALLALEQG